MEIVDDFEDGDIDEYEPHYSDPSLALETFDVVSGSLSGGGSMRLRAHRPDGSGPNPRIHTTEGLDYYPSRGDTIEFYTQYNHPHHTPRFYFGVQDQEENDLYFVEYDSRADVNPQNPDTLRLVRRVDGGDTELARASAPFSDHANEVLRCVIEWADPIEVAFYDSNDDLIADVSASDDTFSDGGIGFRIRGNYRRSDTVYWDRVTAIPGGGSPSPGTGLVWDTTADWDASVGSSGVVHESVANTDHVDAGAVKQGYPVESPVPSTGLIGYWPLQEDSGGVAYDFSGNGIDGTVNGATQGAPGLLGTSAYSFDGSDDVVTISSNPPSLDPTESHSFSVWYYRGRTNKDGEQLVCYSNGDNRVWGLSVDRTGDGEVGARVLNKNLGIDVSVSGSDAGVGWNHVAHTWDPASTTLRVYVNGLEVSNSNVKHSRFGFNELTFGRQPNVDNRPNRPFLGRLTEARGYDRVLSTAEIQALYDVVAAAGTIATDRREVPE